MASRKPPAALVINPSAGRLTHTRRQDVVDALSEKFRLEVFTTTARDTGIKIASDAAAAGAKLVIAFGGDGHVNEVANGVAGTRAALGIIPGGTMNAFARTLGIPLDPFKAIEHLRNTTARSTRTIPLGQMDGRYFTFSAGCGFDAEAAQRVEGHRPGKRHLGELFFYWSAFRVLAGSYRRRRPTMVLKGDFGEVPVSMAIASNAGPYAYLAGRAVDIAPEVTLEGGIDVFALKSMRLESLPFYVWRVMVSGNVVHHRDAFYASDLAAFELSSDEPFSRHVDGEPLPPAVSARFSVVRNALRVRA